ncbi:MAG TPA: hypothetical protein VGN95_03545 [Pyrinomonadaceae bacterium]|nr:hypothetical protein [Pyrinomonadaceae bacterium]
MEKLQRFCATLTLTLALSLSISAGEIMCPGVVAEPPPPPHQTSTTGEIGTPGISAKGDILPPDAAAVDLLTEFTLNLLQSVQSFF